MTEKQELKEMYSRTVLYAGYVVSLRVVSAGKVALEVSKDEPEHVTAFQPQVLIVNYETLSTIGQVIEDLQSEMVKT